MAMKAMKAAKAAAPPRRPKAMKAMKAMKAIKVPKESMKATGKASTKAHADANSQTADAKSKTGALVASWHVNTKNIEEIWVDAILISKRPPLKDDHIIFKVFKKD